MYYPIVVGMKLPQTARIGSNLVPRHRQSRVLEIRVQRLVFAEHVLALIGEVRAIGRSQSF